MGGPGRAGEIQKAPDLFAAIKLALTIADNFTTAISGVARPV